MGVGPQPPIPNPQSPIPNPHFTFLILKNIQIFKNLKNKVSRIKFKNI
jgi:hypothetical protein